MMVWQSASKFCTKVKQKVEVVNIGGINLMLPTHKKMIKRKGELKL